MKAKQIKLRVLIEKEDAHISFDKNKDYYVTKNFIPSEVIGTAKLSHKENEGIFADMEINEGEVVRGLYPAIGFMIKKFHMDGEIRVIDEAEIIGVELCASPNVDESIKPIE